MMCTVTTAAHSASNEPTLIQGYQSLVWHLQLASLISTDWMKTDILPYQCTMLGDLVAQCNQLEVHD